MMLGILLLLFSAHSAWATSASISISGNEGLITLSATASFSTYVNCDPQGSTNCVNVNSGTLYVYQNGILMGLTSGGGSALWSTTLDGGGMAQGSHTFTATGADSQGVSASESASIAIDNTPQVSVLSPGLVRGAFDILGAVQFKERIGGNEGSISVYVDVMPPALPEGAGSYEGTVVNWSFSQLARRMLDAGSLAQGTHAVHVFAQAANGASSWGHGTFIIDNTPVVTVQSLGQVAGAFDISGTVEFKERVEGNEGSIEIFIDGTDWGHRYGGKEYNQTSVNWTYVQVVGTPLDGGVWSQGVHTVYVRAKAYNNALSQWAQGTFIIDNTPVVTVQSPGQVEGGFDITGTAQFKERLEGNEGSIEIYIDGTDWGHRYGGREYNKTDVTWSYSEIVGQMLNSGAWSQGFHTIYVKARAYNGAYSDWVTGTFEVTQLTLAKNLGDGCGPCETRPRTTHPINYAVGNKFLKEVDLALEGPGLPIGFKRYYNSKSTRNDSLGYGWSASFTERVTTSAGNLILSQADGGEVHFISNVQGKFISETDQAREIEPVSGGGYRLLEPDGRVLIFNSYGQLTQMMDRNGNALNLAYASGKLSSVQDSFGRSLQFTYDEGRLKTLDSPVGQSTYGYDSLGNLTSVTNPELRTRTYLYEDPGDTHNLTGIIDERGTRSATVAYDAQDRAILSEGAGGLNRVEITYENNYARKVKDSLGRMTSYKLFQSKGIGRVKSSTGAGCGSCLGSPGKEYELSERLSIAKETDGRGTSTLYTYDERGNVLTRKEAAGTLAERIVSYTYHPTYNFVASVTRASAENPGQSSVTSITYDQKGNLLSKTDTGYSRASFVGRTTTCDYNAFGQIIRLDGPRLDLADITLFEYYPNDSSVGLNRGMLRRIVNALGHETLFLGYNVYGKPLEIRDSNGIQTSLSYDRMGRLISRTIGGRATSFEYDEVGNLLRTTLANGLRILHTYAPSGLLETIEDSAGNYIRYFYDAEGNPIREEIHDREGTLKRCATFEYDDYNRLKKIIYPNNHFEERSYDSVGNLIRRQDPNGNVTVYDYDALNRLTTVLEPNNGWTRYAYDTHDNLIGVTDAENHSTTYAYSDLGDLVVTLSPDTNLTSHAYDPAGNTISKNDANGNTIAYTYDALNRLTGIRFPDAAQDITYGYDSGTNGKGRLTGMTDQGGFTAYAYDEWGNLKIEDRRIDGISYATGYEYDPAGLFTAMTYPSGRSVFYELDASGRVKKVTGAKDGVVQTLANNLTYLPFGPLQGRVLGNGISQTRGYDQQYRLTSLVSGAVQSLNYTTDPAGNITGIRDNLETGTSQLFSYDNLHRLIAASGAYGTLSYSYDKVGNRLREISSTQTDTYSYIHGTNKLSQLTGPKPLTFSYDQNGNTTAMGEMSFIYDQNNRLIRALNNGVAVGEYTYNGQGQRVKKVAGGKTTVFIYDKEGHLISEYDGLGNLTKEYLFLDGAPLAQFLSEEKANLGIEVKTSKGYPLSGVKVYAFKESGSYTGAYDTTGEDGVTSLSKSDLSDGYFKLRADYLSHQFWSEVFHLPGANEIQILIEEQTTEVVISVAGGVKEGVKVYLFNEAGTYLGLFDTTDSEGKVHFELPTGKSFKFRADFLSNQYWTDPVVIGAGGTASLALNAGGGQLSLTLEEGPGQALPGIKTYLFSSSGTYLGLSGTTNENGRVAYQVSGGNYRIRADHLGYRFWSEDIGVYNDSSSVLLISHQDVSVTLKGVFGTSAEPRSNVKMYLFTPSGSYLGVQGVSDEEGKVIFHLPNEDYKVRADCMNRQYWSEIFKGIDQSITILEGVADISVTNMGNPVAGVPVYVFDSAGNYLNLSGLSGSLGMVSFRLPEAEYKLRADYMGGQYWSENTTIIQNVDNPIEISTGGGAFELTVQKGEKDPLVGVNCYLFSSTGIYLGTQGVTNSDGAVSFNLADGNYKIRIDYMGYQFWTNGFSVPGFYTLKYAIPHDDVVVTVNGVCSGEIEPVEDITVYLCTPGGVHLSQSKITDELGKAAFSLPQKDYKVRVDYLSQQYWSREFTWSDVTVNIPEGIAEVHVVHAAEPLSNVDVHVFNSAGNYLSICERTDASGTASFRLPVGTYKLRGDYQGSQYWATETVDPDIVKTIMLDTGGGPFKFTVQKAGGEPLANVPVYLFSSAGTYLSINSKSGSQGEVAFDLSDGSYKLRVDYLGYQFWSDTFSVPTTMSITMTLPHQDVKIRVSQAYQAEKTALGNVRVYLFTSGGSYLNKYADTTALGEVVFSLPEKSFKARADYLGTQYWSSVFIWQDQEVDISHGRVELHITWNGSDAVNAPVYLFTDKGSYLNKYQKTNAEGHVAFQVPAKPYKFRVDYSGKQYWSGVKDVFAGEELRFELPLEQLGLIPTNNPKPSRYDGEPPVCQPEPIKLASLGSLVGILSQAAIANLPDPVVYYYINDHLGTPQLLLDANGSIAWRATYKPFGEAMINPTPTSTSNLRFPGQYLDDETGLHYNYFRYYQSGTGTFLSPDPAGHSGKHSPFNYARANPVNVTDPLGLFPLNTHEEILVDSLGNALSKRELAIVINANKRIDIIQRRDMHFDNGRFEETLRRIDKLWEAISHTCDRGKALDYFGQITHAVHDFYSHSTYIERYLLSNPLATPADIPHATNMAAQGGSSGSFSIFQWLIGADTHDVINKDSPSRDSGKRLSPAGFTYFEYAKSAASSHTVVLYRRFLSLQSRCQCE